MKNILKHIILWIATILLSFSVAIPARAAYSVLHSDNFNRSNRSLSGDTMSDGVGQWTISGTYNIVSNVARGGSTFARAYDNVMSAVDAQRVTATNGTTGAYIYGISVRYSAGAFYYLDFGYFGSGLRLYYVDASDNWTSLGSGGTSAVSGDVMSLEANGTALTAKQNGSTVISVTDSTLSTGVGGMYDYNYSGNQIIDDWQVETDIGGGAPAARRRSPLPILIGL